jgi:hypothetical protein
LLCRRCERRLWGGKLLRFWAAPGSVWGARRISELICHRCGGVLPADLVTERLLSKLSQLGRFGLAGAERPLLGYGEGDE